jgi:hypothetical protein
MSNSKISENIVSRTASLTYLTNPLYQTMVANKIHTHNGSTQKQVGQLTAADKKDIRFYRKRLLATIKDLIKGEESVSIGSCDLISLHNEYLKQLIIYFKMVDTKDILQGVYKDADAGDAEDVLDVVVYKEGTNTTAQDDMAMSKANEFMYKKTVNYNSLDDYVVIVPNTCNDVKIIPPPQQKHVNLTNPALRIKGVRPRTNVKKMLIKSVSVLPVIEEDIENTLDGSGV